MSMMIRKTWAIILLAILTCSCTRQKPPVPQLNTENFLPKVRANIESALKAALANPDDAATVGKLGMLLSAHNLMAAAAQCFERARALEPKSFRWTYYLATSQTDQEKSITALEEGLRLDPSYVPARLRLADLLLAANRPEKCLTEYEAVYQKIEKPMFDKWPDDYRPFLLKGVAHTRMAWICRGNGYANTVTNVPK